MKRESAAAILLLLAVTPLTSIDLQDASDKKRESEKQNSSKQQHGYMTPEGVYVSPSKPSSTVDLDKFLPRRTTSPE